MFLFLFDRATQCSDCLPIPFLSPGKAAIQSLLHLGLAIKILKTIVCSLVANSNSPKNPTSPSNSIPNSPQNPETSIQPPCNSTHCFL